VSESSAVEMCAQGIDWDILYALQVNKPKTLQELAIQAHDMELTITYYGRRLNDDESVASSRNESSMFRDSEGKECPYSKSDVTKILDKLLKKGLIELLESSLPEEIKRTNDPKYCVRIYKVLMIINPSVIVVPNRPLLLFFNILKTA